MMDSGELIAGGRAVLGMELGSTRIKATLIAPDNRTLAAGGHAWENRRIDGVWSYTLDDVHQGIAAAFADLQSDVKKRYGAELTSFAAGGFSAMMHGYLAFNRKDELLVPFRTWRNNITAEAAEELTDLFEYPVPQRWSIAHLHQAVLNNEDHVGDIAFITTLAGYVHWRLTGRRVLGVCDASGMFPIHIDNPGGLDFDRRRIALYDAHIARRGFSWTLGDILPRLVPVGEIAGRLSAEGAALLDPGGALRPGIPLAPPEGDAGTGMAATNSVRPRTGNVSAGTSVFAMLVMEKEPSRVYKEIDLITTPDGKLVGMAHSNNCTSDYDAWMDLFAQAAAALGARVSTAELYDTLLPLALSGDADCGGLLAYGYISGEHLTGFSEGRPLFVRPPECPLTIENFIRTHLFTALCALRIGLNVLMDQEGVQVDEIRGHGGFFKTADTGRRIMAAAARTPVSISERAGEGGAWGMALLAAYMLRENRALSLADYLDTLLSDSAGEALKPDPADVEGFNIFFDRYRRGLTIESAAVQALQGGLNESIP